MTKKFICPNCGAESVLPSATDNLTCPLCRTSLRISSDSKIILAQPSSSYLDEDKTTQESLRATQDSYYDSPKLSESRQKRATMLVHERISQEKKVLKKGTSSGILAIIIGLLFLGVVGIQIYFLGVNETSIIGIFIGIFAIVVGFSVVIWFKRAFHLDD